MWRVAALAVCLVIVAGVGVWSSGMASRSHVPPSPSAGSVDLRNWNFARNGPVSLAGHWLYYDRRWATGAERGGAVNAVVPGPWPAREASSSAARREGFGTYTVTLRLPAAPAGDSFAAETGQIWSAYRVLANGRIIASPGTPSQTPQGERANSYSTLAELPGGTPGITLSFELSNHLNRYGGIYLAPLIGLKSALASRRRFSEVVSLVVLGALLFTACYHIAFLYVTRAGYANLWFGVLAALFGGRMFFTGTLTYLSIPVMGQDWVWRCDLAATDLLLPAAYWFLALSFPRHISGRFGYILASVSAILALASLAAGPVVGELTLKSTEVIALVVLPYLAQAIFRSARTGDHGAHLALLGVTICALAAFHDILIENSIIAGSNFLPLGCVAFFLLLAGALTQRSHHAFVSVELLADERTQQLHEKIAELELARAAAVSANIAKSRFLANMSHELRTPLNAILGFSEVMRDRIFGGDISARYVEYAGSIHTSGSHLLVLITDILDLAKIEAGKLELVDTWLDLGEEARSALRLLEPQAQSRNVGLALTPGEPHRVLADARAVQQILLNLLSNAVKFTPSGGVVTVTVASAPDKFCAITVRDNGMGIRPEDMERVFENFGQARADVRSAGERGTGLGLPISRGLVEAMGGRIEIASTIDVGTTVIVRLPIRRNIAPADKARAA